MRRGWLGVVETVLTVGAFAVLVLLWAGVAWTVLVDGSLPEAAWTWVQGLATAAQVVVWIVLLPVMVGLWAWNADLPWFAGLAVALLLVAWTAASAASTARLLRSRRAA